MRIYHVEVQMVLGHYTKASMKDLLLIKEQVNINGSSWYDECMKYFERLSIVRELPTIIKD
jgi:hypothetical protein